MRTSTTQVTSVETSIKYCRLQDVCHARRARDNAVNTERSTSATMEFYTPCYWSETVQELFKSGQVWTLPVDSGSRLGERHRAYAN